MICPAFGACIRHSPSGLRIITDSATYNIAPQCRQPVPWPGNVNPAMPADYVTTARALALPVSPPRSPVSHHSAQPLWSRRRTSHSVTRSQSSLTQKETSLRDKIINNVEKIGRETMKRLTPRQIALAFVFGIVTLVLAILFLVFHNKIFDWLEPKAESWKSLRGGWCILWAMTFTTAFPPVIGYSLCLTTAGFVYGFPEG